MRGLFKNQADNTLFTVKIRDAYYDPEKSWLCFDTEDSDHIIIPYIPRSDSRQFIKALYKNGKADFSHKFAYLNEEPRSFTDSF